MPNIITVKIDIKKLDMSRVFRAQSGAEYLDLVLFPNREPGRYGDTHIVKQSATKEERDARTQLPIVGNATERTQQASTQAKPAPKPAPAPENDEVPF